MSIYIKGMKMPENCESCAFETGFGFCLAKSDNFCGYTNDCKRPEWCPLVEVPEQHGRLIDADALVPDVCHDWNGWRVPSDDYSEECIRNAPTVIEEEGE